MGEIYSDVEQTSDSVRCYEKALEMMTNLNPTEIPKFIYYLALLYNMLGLSYINRESYHEGMGCLARAYQLYEDFLKLKT